MLGRARRGIYGHCAMALLLGGEWLLSGGILHAQTNVLTWHNDNARTGQDLHETILTPSNVNSRTFGLLGVLSVDGKVDAQPLYVQGVTIPGQGVHNVLYVATEHGSLYAFDADTRAQLKQVSLLGASEVPSDDHGCGQVTPEIGITGTPAIDLQAGQSGMIYAIAQSKDTSGHYHHRLHALDLPTLSEQLGGPVEIQATFPGSGVENTFNPAVHVARPGLLISNGVVYTSWGSHCDAGSYAGWVLSYNETTLRQVGVINLIPNGNDGGIWAAGSGPAADSNGNVFLLTGNGTFDTALNSSNFPSKGDYGNSFVKLSTSGALSVLDYFTMLNTVSESASDVDLGSGGLMLLPPLDNGQGTGTSVSLVVGAGKDTNIYVLNQGNLGKFNPTMDSIYQLMSGALPGGAWSSPAWFNGTLYYGGVGDNLKAFTFAGGHFTLTASSANSFTYPGTTPSVSANGTANGIVWTADNQSVAVLHAYDASNVATELYNSNQASGGRDHFGTGNKFIVPTIANGKVYVGTTNGVGVFGLLAPACSIVLGGGTANLPATGTSTPGACPSTSQPSCGFAPEVPLSVTVTPSASCAWTATSSDPGLLAIPSGASGTGAGAVGFTLLNNTHVAQQTYTITVSTSTSSAAYTVKEAGSADSLLYREVYALYEQLLGRDPDSGGFGFWTGAGTAGLGQMADSFLTSPEAFNSDFAVMAAYQAATGAVPGYAAFRTAVSGIRSGGQTIAQLFTSLIASNPSYSAATLYQNLLNRPPSASETASAGSTAASLAAWFETLIGYPSDMTPADTANNEFQTTGTFAALHSAACPTCGIDHTNGLYIAMLYYTMLGRDPDSSGDQFWLGVANGGGPGILFQGPAGFATRIQILGPGTAGQGFAGSTEFQGLYQ